MKNNLKITVAIAIGALCSCKGVGLWNLEEVNPCEFSARFRIEKNSICPVPCNVRFISDENADDANLRYNWIFSNGIASFTPENAPVTEQIITDPGSYSIMLTVSGYGCEEVDTGTFFVGIPPPTVEFMPGDTTVIAPTTLSFVAKTSGDTSLQWFVGGNPAGTQPQISWSFTRDDAIVVSLKAMGAGGTTTVSHKVIARPETFPLRKFTVGIAGQSEAAWGVDEAVGQGFYVLVNNLKANYLVTTDKKGTVSKTSGPWNLDGFYSQIRPASFEKTNKDYLLVGTAVKSNGFTDYFVFKALSNFTFNGEQVFYKPLSNANENATGIVSHSDNSHYLVNGEGEWNGNKGLYLSTVDPTLYPDSTKHKQLFVNDVGIRSRAIDALPGGQYILTADSDVPGRAFAQLLDANLNPTGSRIDLGTTNFTVLDIVVWDASTVFVFGKESGQAKLVKIEQSQVSFSRPYGNCLFNAGLRSSDGRLIFVGKNTVSNLPAWYEIDPHTGDTLATRDFPSDLISAGQFYALAETRDGGFVLAGEGALPAQFYQTILVKTDRNGRVD